MGALESRSVTPGWEEGSKKGMLGRRHELGLEGRVGALPSSQSGKGHSWQSVQLGWRPRIVKEPHALGEPQAVLSAWPGVRRGGPW